MEGKSTIPKKDADFNVVQNVIFTKSEQNMNLWGLDVNWFTNTLAPKWKILDSNNDMYTLKLINKLNLKIIGYDCK
jgi:hypothetical protein